MAKWPKDNQAALIKFYGDPGSGEVGGQLTKITPPFKMYYDGKPLKTLTFHEKAAPALLAALGKVWDYYGRNQARIDKLGISKTAGTYNPRKVRGSQTKWSNHAYGAAIDINAEQNGFNVAGNIPLPMIAAFKSEGFRWGGDYKSRKDPMHFEACDGGEKARTFEEWLAFYKCPPSASVEPTAPALPPVAVPSSVTPVGPPIDETVVQGDADVWNAQRRLKAMGYNPGGLDGIWGGMTAGAITAFINDRGLKITPPTSAPMFRASLQAFRTEMGKAEAERFTRPIAPERSEATESQVANKAPEIVPARQNKFLAFWAAIGSSILAAINAISEYFKDGLEWISGIKDMFTDIPGWAWLALAAVIAGLFAWNSQRSASAITKAYQDGERS